MGPGNIDDHTPGVEDILNEAQRRLQERGQQEPPARQAWVDTLNRGVYWLARHWLAVFNVLVGIFVGGALLPPVLLKFGLTRMADVVYAIYRPLCHQYPFRSWFLFGPQLAYPLTAPVHVAEMNALRSFVGDAHVGYKTALCQRDVAIYGAMLLAGLVYSVLRRRKPVQPWPMWRYFAFGVLPMMLDGGIQWISYALWAFFPSLIKMPFETTPLMRALTGALFGLGIVAAAYPYLNEYFEDVHRVLKQKYSATIPSLEVTP
ncbi:MAG: DUF2085 domain-containing protein [Anaerolineae bacterium]|nr:DUF2085 domain-containing protein [Anaerolineae bacterium]